VLKAAAGEKELGVQQRGLNNCHHESCWFCGFIWIDFKATGGFIVDFNSFSIFNRHQKVIGPSWNRACE
jgi:hypothetical protein